MPIAALGRGDRVPFDLPRRASDRRAVEVHQPHCAGGDLGQLAILQHQRAARVLENRGNIRRDEVLALAEAEHQRRRGLGGDQLAGLGFRQHDDRERTADSQDRLAHRLGQTEPAFELLLDQMRDQFGVGFGAAACGRATSSSARSSTKFSTMPLWMTATGPALCGCAFSSDGRPCVAHRVWPIPIWPAAAPRRAGGAGFRVCPWRAEFPACRYRR